MLRTRILSAAVLIPIVIAAIWFGDIALTLFTSLCAVLATREYISLVQAESGGPQGTACPSLPIAVIAAVAFVFDAAYPEFNILSTTLLLLVLGAIFIQLSRKNQEGTMNGWALTVAGAIYIGFCLSYAVRLRALDQGFWWLLLSIVSTWIGDTAAYLVGSRWGKTPLLPQISPHKTIEGASAEIIVGTLVVMLLIMLLPIALKWWQSLILGFVISIGAILGDLAESAIKRQVHVKDSSQLIPGHGGMFDRVDSLLVTVPLTYYAVLLFL